MRVGILLLGGVIPAVLAAQSPARPGTLLWDYARLLELDGQVVNSAAQESYGQRYRMPTSGHPWADHLLVPVPRPLQVLPLDLRLTARSRLPRAASDGALWAGKGLSGSVTGGLTAMTGPLTVTLAPTAWFAANADFDPAPVIPNNRSPYAYPWSQDIDWPQRPGPDAVARVDPGQTEARIVWHGATVGFGWQNLWWGPSARNPLIMGATGPGFPHADVGTARPVDIGVGHLDGRLVWGALSESAWFDTIPGNDRRFFVGMTLKYEPSPLPGFAFGIHRVFYKTWDSLNAGDWAAPFQALFKNAFGSPTDPNSNDDRDQLLSFSARWVLRESRAAAWFEWGRNDHNLDLRDFLQEPDHSRAWSIGFEKAFGSNTHRTHLLTEFTQLGRSATFQQRASPTWYTHSRARQGYTHLGQLLAAPIGPGAESQHLQAYRYHPSGRWGLSMTRVVFNNDEYYRRLPTTRSHEVDLTGAVHYLRWFDRIAVGATVDVTRTMNRWYVDQNDHTAVNLVVEGRWDW